MEVKHEVVSGGGVGDTVGHLSSCLVVAVKEIHLETLDAHVAIFLAGLLKLIVEHIEDSPQPKSHTLAVGIIDEHREVDLRDCGEHIPTLRVIPTLVEHNIFNAVFGGEVDEILVSIVVDARFEGHVAQSPVVPPFPGGLTRLYP